MQGDREGLKRQKDKMVNAHKKNDTAEIYE